MFTWSLSLINDVIHSAYIWYIPLIYIWYIFVFRISWAASQSPRSRPTGYSGRLSSGPTTWQNSNCRISKHGLMRSLMERIQARQCVQQRSARRAGVLRHNCLIRTLYFHFETPRKFGRRSRKNAGGFSTGMEHRTIAAKLSYLISEVNM
jgi:hypothetical protein